MGSVWNTNSGPKRIISGETTSGEKEEDIKSDILSEWYDYQNYIEGLKKS